MKCSQPTKIILFVCIFICYAKDQNVTEWGIFAKFQIFIIYCVECREYYALLDNGKMHKCAALLSKK